MNNENLKAFQPSFDSSIALNDQTCPQAPKIFLHHGQEGDRSTEAYGKPDGRAQKKVISG